MQGKSGPPVGGKNSEGGARKFFAAAEPTASRSGGAEINQKTHFNFCRSRLFRCAELRDLFYPAEKNSAALAAAGSLTRNSAEPIDRLGRAAAGRGRGLGRHAHRPRAGRYASLGRARRAPGPLRNF